MPHARMLVLAREARGFTQQQLSRATGISQPVLSRYETGLVEIPGEHIEVLSKRLRFPTDFFSQTDAVYSHGSGCLYQRCRASISALEYRQLVAQTNVISMQVSRLLQGTETKPQNQMARLDIADYGHGAPIAKAVRVMWNLPAGPIPDLMAVIESSGGIPIRCQFDTRKLDAFSMWVPGMPPLYFFNAEIPPDRLRWTLAHELGHLFMHRIPSERQEEEADQFAAEFLMPERDIAHQLRPMSLPRAADLKQFWRVSMAALIVRAKDLSRITPHQYKRLFTELSRRGFRINEPVELEREEPKLLGRILELHTKAHRFTIQDLAKVANAEPEEFEEFYGLKRHSLRLIQ